MNSVANRFSYLGQEEQNDLGLDWLTFRYRNYMPEIGRFFGSDPITEDFLSISNYQFAHNSPIWKIELEGLEGEISPDIPGAIDIPNHEPVIGNTNVGSSAIPIGDSTTHNYGSRQAKPKALPTNVRVDVEATMEPVLYAGGALVSIDGPAPFGDAAAATLIIGTVAALGIISYGVEIYNDGATIYNSAVGAEEASEESESREKSGESTKENGKLKTENELEASLNQIEGIQQAQEDAKQEVKGQKQNKIKSIKKSKQRLENALKRIDLDDLIGG